MSKKDKITFKKSIPQFFSALKTVWRFDRKFVLVSCFVYLFSAIPTILGSFATAQFNANLLTEIKGTYSETIVPLLMLILINLIDYVIFGIYFWIQERVTTKLTSKLLDRYSKKAISLDYSYFDNSEFYNKVANGWSQDGTVLVQNMQQVCSSFSFIFSYITYFSVLMWLDWKLLLLLIIVSFLYTPLSDLDWKLKNKLDKEIVEISRREGYYQNFFSNKNLSSDGKISNYYNYAEKNFFAATKKIYAKKYKFAFKTKLVDLLSIVVQKLPAACVYIYLSIQVVKGNLSIANMVLYTTMFEGFMNVVYNTVGGLSNFKYYARESYHVQEFLSLPSKMRKNEENKLMCFNRVNGHKIEFKNVSFIYPGTEKKVLENISFCCEPGEIVSIIGNNGAGKSTLIHLLMRLYDPTEGEIYIDDKEIKAYSLESIYNLYGVLFQDYYNFILSARESITLSDEEIDEKRLKDSLEFSTSNVFMTSDSGTLDSCLSRKFDERGIELSIGQKQRIALARGFYKDSSILIMDEPSASIDPISETKILENIKNLKGEKNIFVISHRLSSCVLSDRILLLKDSHLIANGTHEDLIKSNMEYKRMFNIQSKRYGEIL